MNRPEPIELENNLGPDAVTGEINRVPWMAYDVDEMDIYIAEKDKEIAELKEFIENYRFDNKNMLHKIMKQDAELRHHKYKRCLAMAEWCNSEMGRETFACFRPRHTKEVWREEHEYWAKWRKIWFKLYKKFKEVK